MTTYRRQVVAAAARGAKAGWAELRRRGWRSVVRNDLLPGAISMLVIVAVWAFICLVWEK